MNLNDELDHFGLYVAENNYAQLADELTAGQLSHLSFDGYRNDIDAYFAAVLRGEDDGPPAQKPPHRIAEIIAHLDRTAAPGSSELASHLLDWAGDFRLQISEAIDKQLDSNGKLGRAKPLSTYGDVRTTIYTWSPHAPMRAGEGVEHTRAIMAMHDEVERRLIELEYDADRTLTSATTQLVALHGLTAVERARAEAGATNIRRRRLKVAHAAAKVGRNEPCPCASGEKFKKCCGA
ncbi:YecA family protein [Caulobacter sp. ErkDOM-E]|uniref:YecA family protein n=1 Tax=Caulobacter sp. ErkDOM-E TaxID=3402778 RepID=UPI003AF7AC05